ncbi:hypothetical protein GCM10009795_007950 [Nocardioides hankookensis]
MVGAAGRGRRVAGGHRDVVAQVVEAAGDGATDRPGAEHGDLHVPDARTSSAHEVKGDGSAGEQVGRLAQRLDEAIGQRDADEGPGEDDPGGHAALLSSSGDRSGSW